MNSIVNVTRPSHQKLLLYMNRRTLKMQILEDHMLEWLSMHQAGCGLMGELGAYRVNSRAVQLFAANISGIKDPVLSKVEKYTARPLSKHITSYDICCATPLTYDTKACSESNQFQIACIFKALKGYERTRVVT